MLKELKKLNILFSHGDKKKYLILLFLMLIGAFLELAGIGIIPAFISVLIEPDVLLRYDQLTFLVPLIKEQPLTVNVIVGSAIMILLFLVKNSYFVFLYFLQFKITEYHRVRMADRVFSGYLHAPYIFMLNKNSAEILRNTHSDTQEIIQGVVQQLLNVILGLLVTVLTVILLVISLPALAFLGILVLALGSLAFTRVTRNKLNLYGVSAKKERKKMVQHLNEGVSILVEAKVAGSIDFLRSSFRSSLSSFAKSIRLKQTINKASPYILEFITTSGVLLAVVLLFIESSDHKNIVPQIALLGVSMMRLKTSVSQIVSGVSQIRFSIPSISNVVSDLRYLESQKSLRKAANEELPFNTEIALEKVSFRYSHDSFNVLRDINFVVKKGQSVALIGPTGSGKSTLLNIILGVLTPTTGKVQVDGRDIQRGPESWHRKIGYIPQLTTLLDTTIAENIALGKLKDQISDQRLQEVIKVAQLKDLIDTLPDGLNTVVGERGTRLSGGQRQRISIARALYNDPEILVMDEPTSALDGETERLLLKAISKMKAGRTFILVTHKIDTITEFDQVIDISKINSDVNLVI